MNIEKNEVHIWSACLSKNEKNIEYFSSLLSKDEHERSTSFKFIKDQKQLVIARGILRKILSDYLEELPENLQILYGLWGKPCLPKNKFLHFSVSHSGDYALYALAYSFEVGIDLEYIDSNLELENMALYVFSPGELVYWKTLNPKEKAGSFFKRWVAREAFLKAYGKGWLEEKDEFIEKINMRGTNKAINEEMNNLYYFESIPGYASALFVKEGEFSFPNYLQDQVKLIFKEF